jgi:hypothetical protein
MVPAIGRQNKKVASPRLYEHFLFVKKTTSLLLLIAAFAAPAEAAEPSLLLDTCQYYFNAALGLNGDSGLALPRVDIPTPVFDRLTNNLRRTLSGKLATVWRSEWKNKLAVKESNQLVREMVEKFFPRSLRRKVLDGLDPDDEGFVRQAHRRIYELQLSGEIIKENAQLLVRDAPPLQGVSDSTFTYYTKSIKGGSENALGKHQIRVRTYVRRLELAETKAGDAIEGFNEFGNAITIVKVPGPSPASYDITVAGSTRRISEQRLLQELGDPPMLYAPHGKNFKLEVKTATKELIEGKDYPMLNGGHMVQKLDASLTPNQVQYLFGPLESRVPGNMRKESLARIAKLKSALKKKDPKAAERIDAVFAVLETGVQENARFLRLEGATHYERSAFESPSGFQFTVDRNQGAYRGDMYDTGLKNPMRTLATSRRYQTSKDDARHVELKFPATAVSKMLGLKFSDPESAALANQPASLDTPTLGTALDLYHKYLDSSEHVGKFGYLTRGGEDDPFTGYDP